ncbi:gamma-glutamyltransferase [Patulibacter americanus]|uniref:gamma-glutamyltransferase n=1 Tax=Patulibacter americanus TaxID=588672 RepID=UPI0003B7A647|nr:gamma-glutamyltransferase [Patulibacter americanus]
MSSSRGTVAAGHPRTAEVGAAVLREGGTAADAVVAAALASWVCEPLLTGPAAGGHLLAVPATGDAVAIDAFCSVPGRDAPAGAGDPLDALVPVQVDFGGAHQTFHAGVASVAAFGLMDGLERLHRRWGRLPLADLAAPAAAMAREGVALNEQQAFVAVLLEGILGLTPESRALWFPEGRVLREGEVFLDPELGDTIERLGREGAAPLRDGDLAAACADWCAQRGGTLTRADQAAYRAVERPPIALPYRDREILTVPPPSAGGVLLALALGRLEAAGRGAGVGQDATARGEHGGRVPPSAAALVAAMADADAERTAAFEEGLVRDGFADELLALRLGSTTHVSVIDADGLSCALTATNGEGSGVVVPGTGIHLNNVMGEEDLNPRLRPGGRGLDPFAPGRRMPSMMAPTAVRAPGGRVEAILGSAGSNRIRSALLQTVVGLVDHGRGPVDAVDAPRVHLEDGVVYAEPGVDPACAAAGGQTLVEFRERNLFFGGVQLVCRDPETGALSAAADPRRGGAVATA